MKSNNVWEFISAILFASSRCLHGYDSVYGADRVRWQEAHGRRLTTSK